MLRLPKEILHKTGVNTSMDTGKTSSIAWFVLDVSVKEPAILETIKIGRKIGYKKQIY